MGLSEATTMPAKASIRQTRLQRAHRHANQPNNLTTGEYRNIHLPSFRPALEYAILCPVPLSS
jgi:hypothetical protein